MANSKVTTGLLLLVMVALVCGGCTGPNSGAVGPAYDRYDGLYFGTKSGGRDYENVVIIPRLVTKPLTIRLGDRGTFALHELTEQGLQQKNIKTSRAFDNGRGTYQLDVGPSVGVNYHEHQVDSVIIIHDPFAEFDRIPSFEFNGHTIRLPIEGDELKRLLGKPDEVNKPPP